MELRILGPLEVRVDGSSVPIRRGIPRRILTLLAARHGSAVSADTLAELAWGDALPANPLNALHTQISHLRRMLRPLDHDGTSIVRTVPAGYVLDVPRHAVDAARFEDMVHEVRALLAAGTAHDLSLAVTGIDAALALWNGEALADAAGDPVVAADAARLEELRVAAREARGDALLRLGRHADLVPDAQRAVVDHPLHERFHAQLIVALYRCGRQVDALRAAQHVRRVLADEVGVDPGHELVALERQVLEHDEALDWTPPRGSGSASSAPPAPDTAPEAGPAGPPPVARYHVVRPHLDAMLDDAAGVPLVVVSAPAGAGKTATLGAWLQRRQRGGWVALHGGHDDPAVFWPAVAGALGLPGAADLRDVAAVRRALQDEHRDDDRVVVLDDYHVITNPTVHAGVDELVTAGTGARVVLATRHDPPLRLASLRAGGALREIRFEDLRFGEREVAGVVAHIVGEPLAPDEVARLLDRTAGWAVGVQLAAVSLQHQPDRESFVRQFAGDDRHVADYLREEVLSRVDDALAAFLLDTAILDRLHPALCASVACVDDAHDRLLELERRNLFVLPLDHRRQWYRYHPLFAEWLRLHPRGGVEDRHRRAATWLAANGFPGDAVHHFVAAGDADAAADLIERERWTLVGQGRQRTLQQWTRMLPESSLRTRPRLTTALAWIAYDDGRWADVEHLAGLVDAGDLGDDRDANLLRAEVALLTAGRLTATGRLAEAGALAADALELLPKREPRARCGLLLVLGKCRLAAGDHASAATAFRDAAWLAAPHDLPIIEVIAGSHLAEIARLDGDTREAERSATSALDLAERAGLADHPETAVAHLVLAHLHLDARRVELAAVAIERAAARTSRVPYVLREQALEAARRRLDEVAGPSAVGHPADRLTTKEQAVLRLLPTSLTPQQIATELYVSLNTVKSHTRTLYRKLGVHDRHTAIERARELNLL